MPHILCRVKNKKIALHANPAPRMNPTISAIHLNPSIYQMT